LKPALKAASRYENNNMPIGKTTAEPVQPGDFTGVTPEFGRCHDVQRYYGIKRGTAYNLLLDGKIKGVLLRIRGKKSGVRLFDMASIRDFIRSQSYEQSSTQSSQATPRAGSGSIFSRPPNAWVTNRLPTLCW
jgi:hypothetical protein